MRRARPTDTAQSSRRRSSPATPDSMRLTRRRVGPARNDWVLEEFTNRSGKPGHESSVTTTKDSPPAETDRELLRAFATQRDERAFNELVLELRGRRVHASPDEALRNE